MFFIQYSKLALGTYAMKLCSTVEQRIMEARSCQFV